MTDDELQVIANHVGKNAIVELAESLPSGCDVTNEDVVCVAVTISASICATILDVCGGSRADALDLSEVLAKEFLTTYEEALEDDRGSQ